MKRIFLSTALVFIACAMATAQRKMQFGVAVQAGNYLQAHQERMDEPYLISDYQLTAGVLAGLGVYAERPLGRYVALYSALHYSQSAFTEQLSTLYPDQAKRNIGEGTYKRINHFTVRQVALPVQLQLRAGQQRQLAISIGAAPSFAKTQLRPDQNYSTYDPNILICGDFFYNPYGYYDDENLSFTKFQMLFTTGLHYRPDAHNAIGLECWLAPKGTETDPLLTNTYVYGRSLPARSYRMRSLQVSLRHSW